MKHPMKATIDRLFHCDLSQEWPLFAFNAAALIFTLLLIVLRVIYE